MNFFVVHREQADEKGKKNLVMSSGSCPVLHGTKLGINKKYVQ